MQFFCILIFMKPKRLLAIRLLVILVVIGLLWIAWVVHSNWHQLFPSHQMQALRQLETSLDLPKPAYQTEEDLGYRRDLKGAQHYDRHIALSYTDTSVLDSLRSKLLKDSWHERAVDPLGSIVYFSFTKGTGDNMQCVNGYTDSADHDTPLYISLDASGEYTCNPAPGT